MALIGWVANCGGHTTARCFTRTHSQITLEARMFAPDIGVTEDPATGSAAGQLGAYLAVEGAAGLPGTLLIRQGDEVGRPSELRLDVSPNGDSFDVWIEGGVAVVGRGAFELPD